MKDGLLISILSLLKEEPRVLKIFIVTAFIDAGDKKYYPLSNQDVGVLDTLVKQHNSDNQVLKIDITDMFAAQVPQNNLTTVFTPGCMLRLFADELPELPNKILYLDTDVICRKDFSLFYAQALKDTELVGVLDHYGKWFFHHSASKLDYINSGVMLLNLDMIRKTQLFVRCRQLCQSKKMFMPDQSAINKLATTKKIMPRRFNEQRRLHKNTVFQHFTTSFRIFPWIHTLTVKPWEVERVHKQLKLHEYDDILAQYSQLIGKM
ncbi:glycosyl transferase [Paucilactobacillus hokkaidonensis JCM 18461]|uniref:Glycosyl transferase n=2 Tax=Paucilactobacillus hokkaidonensis TaxID=1193095 RepID=A0A0A1GUW0_9LACO|nr:glycosyl transferase [Paucilactobacillus hokkaidonensis JCM 18461]